MCLPESRTSSQFAEMRMAFHRTRSVGAAVFFCIDFLAVAVAFCWLLLSKEKSGEDVRLLMGAGLLMLLFACKFVGALLAYDAELDGNTLRLTAIVSRAEFRLDSCTVSAAVDKGGRWSFPSFILSVNGRRFDLKYARRNYDIIRTALERCARAETSVASLDAVIAQIFWAL